MKNDNYIVIQGWMLNVLGLTGNELVAFALIYGFTQDGDTEFRGSLKYIMKALGCSKPTAIKVMQKLVDKELLIKRIEDVSNVSFNRYRVDLQVVKKLYHPSKETLPEGGKETLPNNTNTDKSIGYSGTPSGLPQSLFDEKEHNNFRDSRVFNKSVFMGKFEKEKEAGVDVEYYYQAVCDWSDKLPTRTKTQRDKALKTDNGWLAEVRTFMRLDNQKNKLKMLNSAMVDEAGGMADYLSRMGDR